MRSTWLSRRAIGLHLTLIVCIPTFLLLGRWQLHRALSGNSLSWAYTFEWPLFAAYAVYMWWKLVHEVGDNQATDADIDGQKTPSPAETEDPELAAYNAYLASLHRRSGDH